MKKNIDAVMIVASKANAQNLTCFVTFIAAAAFAAIMMLVACVLPAMVAVTEVICWISMGLEAVAVALGFIAYWIKRHAL